MEARATHVPEKSATVPTMRLKPPFVPNVRQRLGTLHQHKAKCPDGCWERLGKRAVCLLHHLPPEYPNADASRVTKNRRRAQAREGGGRLVPGA